MNPLKLCCLLALGVAAVSAQGSQSSASSMTEDVTAPITKAELDAIITELKAIVAADPSLADIFNGVDFDQLLTLTPEEARAKLNALVFDATPKPSNNSTEGKDAQAGSVGGASSATTSVPAPAATTAPKSAASSVFSTAAAITAASVVTYVVY